MQRFFRLAVVFLFLATSTCGLAAEWQLAYVRYRSIYVHGEPNTNSPIVTRFDHEGGGFETKPNDTDWWPVKLPFSGATGFVHRSEILLSKYAPDWWGEAGCHVTDIDRPSANLVVYTLQSPRGKEFKFNFRPTFESDPLFVGQKVDFFREDCFFSEAYQRELIKPPQIEFMACPIRWRKVDSQMQFIWRTSYEKKFISLVLNRGYEDWKAATFSDKTAPVVRITIKPDGIEMDQDFGPGDYETEAFVPDARIPELELANKSGKKVGSTAGWKNGKQGRRSTPE